MFTFGGPPLYYSCLLSCFCPCAKIFISPFPLTYFPPPFFRDERLFRDISSASAQFVRTEKSSKYGLRPAIFSPDSRGPSPLPSTSVSPPLPFYRTTRHILGATFPPDSMLQLSNEDFMRFDQHDSWTAFAALAFRPSFSPFPPKKSFFFSVCNDGRRKCWHEGCL